MHFLLKENVFVIQKLQCFNLPLFFFLLLKFFASLSLKGTCGSFVSPFYWVFLLLSFAWFSDHYTSAFSHFEAALRAVVAASHPSPIPFKQLFICDSVWHTHLHHVVNRQFKPPAVKLTLSFASDLNIWVAFCQNTVCTLLKHSASVFTQLCFGDRKIFAFDCQQNITCQRSPQRRHTSRHFSLDVSVPNKKTCFSPPTHAFVTASNRNCLCHRYILRVIQLICTISSSPAFHSSWQGIKTRSGGASVPSYQSGAALEQACSEIGEAGQ